MTRQLRRKFRNNGWGKTFLSGVLIVAAVYAGYWASMMVANRDLPDPSALGVEARGR
jgi:hypothetical protein